MVMLCQPPSATPDKKKICIVGRLLALPNDRVGLLVAAREGWLDFATDRSSPVRCRVRVTTGWSFGDPMVASFNAPLS